MDGDIEAAGAAVTAGAAAAALERKSGRRGHDAESPKACLNCEAALAGPYCAACGQPAHISRKLHDVLHDVLHGAVHFDAKAWRTLPLLAFRPGQLTHRYIHGQRARFISPVALFLFTVFLMFFLFAVLGEAGSRQAALTPEQAAAERALIDRAHARLTEAVAARVDAPDVADAEAALRIVERAREAGRIPPGVVITEAEDGGVMVNLELGEGAGLDILFDEIQAAHATGRLQITTGNADWDKKIDAKLADPEFAWYKIQNIAYKFSFLLVPISLPLVWLAFFWKRGVTLFDHSVFVLYSMSFMSILFMIGVALNRIGGPVTDAAITALMAAAPAHLFFQVKGGYGLCWFSAVLRSVYLLIAAGVALGVFVATIFVLGFLG